MLDINEHRVFACSCGRILGGVLCYFSRENLESLHFQFLVGCRVERRRFEWLLSESESSSEFVQLAEEDWVFVGF